MNQEIKEKVKNYISNELIHDGSRKIDEDTGLISDGHIDSITTLQLVDFLEDEFNIEFEAHEVDRDNLDTLNKIASFVVSKQ